MTIIRFLNVANKLVDCFWSPDRNGRSSQNSLQL